MRHAKSDWSADYHRDFDRPLNRRGKKDASHMGKWLLKNNLVPDRIITSPAERAKGTAEILAETISYPVKLIIQEASLYDANLKTVLGVVRQAVTDNSRPLIIAHNPALDDLVVHLADQPPAFSTDGKLMTTAAIAMFNAVGSIDEGCCQLLQLIRPREHS